MRDTTKTYVKHQTCGDGIRKMLGCAARRRTCCSPLASACSLAAACSTVTDPACTWPSNEIRLGSVLAARQGAGAAHRRGRGQLSLRPAHRAGPSRQRGRHCRRWASNDARVAIQQQPSQVRRRPRQERWDVWETQQAGHGDEADAVSVPAAGYAFTSSPNPCM